MGSSKKITVSYWYRIIAHFGFAKGPLDAMLEIRGGDRVAWAGRMEESGIININAPNLYGGESAEGGIQGQFELMMGDAEQMPNPYLAAQFGDAQPAYRGRATGVLRGPKIGAGNPYPKPLFFKFERILKGWDEDVCWYEEKARVPIDANNLEFEVGATSDGWRSRSVPNGGTEDYSAEDYNDSGWDVGSSPFASSTNHPYAPAAGFPDVVGTPWPLNTALWLRKKFNLLFAEDLEITIFVDNWATVWVNGTLVLPRIGNTNEPGIDAFMHTFTVPAGIVRAGENTIAMKCEDYGSYSYAALRAKNNAGSFYAMNPAHILYDSITSRRENGGMEEPIGRINDASFRKAADVFHGEGLGLCCTWYGGESAEEFQQRICNVAGISLTQSRRDGQYYIHLLRDVTPADVLAMPVITDDDIIEWEAEPALPSEAINQMQVKWFDPATREERITAPIQSLGAIEHSGGVIADTRNYFELPSEALALRTAQRDLQSVSTALWRFTIAVNRKSYDLMVGMKVRLQCPRRGFADLIAVVGEVDFGSFGGEDGIGLVLVQDAFSLPASSFVTPQPSLAPPGSQQPVNINDRVAIESPYVELVAAMPNAELAALTDDIGYLLTAAPRPANGNNYALATKAEGEEYEEYGLVDFTPSALISEEDILTGEAPRTDFTFTGGRLLERVPLGSWALWGEEICRVDALDADARTMTLGRGCADTVPQPHSAGSAIYFAGDWNGSDARQYSDGETVSAKMMNRTGQGQVPLEAALPVSVVMDSRQARPYPPARVRINDEAFPTSVLAGDIEVTWAHRDRVLQADQLVDTEQGDIGPEPGTVYNVRWYVDDVLAHEDLGLVGTEAAYDPGQAGPVRVEIESERDGLVSWQKQVRNFFVGVSPLLDELGSPITFDDDLPIYLE